MKITTLAKAQNKKSAFLRLLITGWLLAVFISGCATVPKIPQAVPVVFQDNITDISGVKYVPLIVVCERLNFKWSWDSVAGKAGIQNGPLYIRFMEGSKLALVNKNIEHMEAPSVLYNGALMIPLSFAQKNILPVVKIPQAQAPVKAQAAPIKQYLLNKVAIDAGHGGKDPGAIGRCGLKEKDVTLHIAKLLKDRLEREFFNVCLTRSDDTFIALSRRPQIANNFAADIFISIHANAAKTKNAKGFEVYYLAEAANESARRLAEAENASLKFEQASFDVKGQGTLEGILWDLVSTENRVESIQLAKDISTQARRHLWVRERGVKSAQFYVLKGARMPAILVEIGFISNRDEEAKLKDPGYRKSVADAIVNGILNYRDEYQMAEGFTK